MAKAQPKPQPKRAPAARVGILPVQAIRGLIDAGQVKLGQPLATNQLQPASLDLRLGARAFRVRASFLPGPDTRVSDKLADLQLHIIDLTNSAVLETGCVYIVPLLESMALPKELAAATKDFETHLRYMRGNEAGVKCYKELTNRPIRVLTQKQVQDLFKKTRETEGDMGGYHQYFW